MDGGKISTVEEDKGSILQTGLCIASNCTKESDKQPGQVAVGQNVAERLLVVEGRQSRPQVLVLVSTSR
jgi:hypothetical protein